MQLTARSLLTQFAHLLQSTLFPLIEETAGPLSAQAQLLVSITSMIALPRFLPYTRGCEGRPLEDRQSLACAFIAKAVYGMQTTRQHRTAARRCAVAPAVRLDERRAGAARVHLLASLR